MKSGIWVNFFNSVAYIYFVEMVFMDSCLNEWFYAKNKHE